MEQQSPLYDKANSILQIRRSRAEDQAVFDRIAKFAAEQIESSQSDYGNRIIRQACVELLEPKDSERARSFFLREHVIEEMKRLADEELGRYLFYRYRYDVFPQTKELDDYPPCLQIEPTSICNYRCVFCFQTDSDFTRPANGHMGMMTFELFREIVDQAAGQCEAITLASRGEPLICKDIERMLSYTAGKFLAMKINTHAGFLDERKAHAILAAGVSTIVFSADAASEPLYSQLRINGNLNRVVANIERFQKIRTTQYPGSRTIARVSGVRYREDQNLDAMERFWGNLVDQVAFVDYNPWENTYERPFSGTEPPCSDLWRRMFVWLDGRVNPCDVDYKSLLAVGRVTESSLSTLWRSEPYNRLREMHLSRQRSQVFPCQRCTVT